MEGRGAEIVMVCTIEKVEGVGRYSNISEHLSRARTAKSNATFPP